MHTRTAAIGVAAALYSTGGGMTSLRCRMPVVHAYLMAGVAMVMMTCAAASNELKGYKGDRLRGSISCIHPNIIHDLIERVGEAENYTSVLRLYLQQGYCVEADIPTILKKPMHNGTFSTWDGHEAEIWETVLKLDYGDGTGDLLSSYSIVFPQEMELAYGD
jgi:hypothetical protein